MIYIFKMIKRKYLGYIYQYNLLFYQLKILIQGFLFWILVARLKAKTGRENTTAIQQSFILIKLGINWMHLIRKVLPNRKYKIYQLYHSCQDARFILRRQIRIVCCEIKNKILCSEPRRDMTDIQYEQSFLGW